MILEDFVQYLRDNMVTVDRDIFPMHSNDCTQYPHITVCYDGVKQKCLGSSCNVLQFDGIITIDVWGKSDMRGDLFETIEEVDSLVTCSIRKLWNGCHYIEGINPIHDWQPINIQDCDLVVYQRQYKVSYTK